MVDLEQKRYPYKIVEMLLKDKRLKDVEGRIITCSRCAYKNGRELIQYGYRFAYSINSSKPLEFYTNGMSFWLEEDNHKLYLLEHVGEHSIREFNKNDTDKIVNYIVNIITQKKVKRIIKEMVI
ncbi:hypothetical protein CLPUN_28150 [Clostridium puniceum]|uniref:Uncharacterized protein n=1 Tax=Clostridium puniceum TaxID=29367 RepID=A0A1S8TF09_9CLOT|nr:hypothetical protein [Clostridium puniceum]OOM76202.1 hypothetical protein CLPUN_28150 [Clostridium puniceum]